MLPKWFRLAAVAAAAVAAAGGTIEVRSYQKLHAEAGIVQFTATIPAAKKCGGAYNRDPGACRAFSFDQEDNGPCKLCDHAPLVGRNASSSETQEIYLSGDVTRVDGNWGQWSDWSECTCFTTEQARTRTCGEPSSGGLRICPEVGEEATEAAECGPCAYPKQFMAVGGDGTMCDVEIFDVESETTNCQSVAAFPEYAYARLGAYADGKPLICGGFYSGAKDYCYSYDFGTNSWTLESYVLPMATSNLSYSAVLPNATWLVLGGVGVAGSKSALFSDGAWTAAPDIPYEMSYGCGVTINATHIFVGGDVSFTTRALIVNVDTWEFTQLDDLAYSRNRAACGLIDNPTNGLEVVVAGGEAGSGKSTSEILSLTTLTWRAGPALPEPLEYAQYAQISPSTFFMAGGYDASTAYHTGIHVFDEVNYGWTTMTRQLATGRAEFVLVLLPQGMGVCT